MREILLQYKSSSGVYSCNRQSYSPGGPVSHDPEGRGIVLRHRDRAEYFHLCWDGNAKYVSGPTLLVDDFDADGRPEAAVILCLGGGTGAYEEDLYIFDLEIGRAHV